MFRPRCKLVVLVLCACSMTVATVTAAIAPDSGVFSSSFEYRQRFVADIVGEPLRAPNPAFFDAGDSLTLEGWFYVERRHPAGAWLIGKGDPIDGGASGIQLYYFLGLDGSGNVEFGSSHFRMQSQAPVPLRRWTHLAAVVEQGAARLYVDGVLAAENAAIEGLPAAPTIPLGIGAPFDAAGVPVPYDISGVHAQRLRVWSVAHSASQLRVDAAAGALPGSTLGLMASWPLDEPRALVARDAQGDAHPLTRAAPVGVTHQDVLEIGPHFTEHVVQVAPGRLTDVSDSAPIDFDDDGDTDLIVFKVDTPTYPATYRELLAFRNAGGTFEDATDEVLGTVELVNPRAWHVGDLNADGRDDLFIGATGTDTDPVPGEQSRLLLQSADGRLVDESATRIPQHESYTHGLGVGDLEGDGDLDLLLANYIRDTPRLYMNDGAAQFSEVTDRLPDFITSGEQQHPSAALCDVNGDGRADAVFGGNYHVDLPSEYAPNELLMQDASGLFVRHPDFSLPPKYYEPEGVTVFITCADLNGDGAPELVLATDIGGQQAGLQLLLNDGAGHFSDASARLNLDIPPIDAWYVAARVVDMNRDGRPDIVLRTNSKRFDPESFSRSLLLNLGDAHFVDASEAFVINTTVGTAIGDFDGDGWPDIMVPQYADFFRFFTASRVLSPGRFAD